MSIYKPDYEDHARQIVEFEKEYSFEEKPDGSVVMKHNGSSAAGVLELVVGKCYAYTERQSTGSPKTYHAILTNIEYKDKKFFSVTVDVYDDTESLHKTNVYVYNPVRLPERTTRFRIKRNTVLKTMEFWKTLTLDESFPKKQHSEIEFFRNAHQYLKPNKTGKSCSIREKNKTLKDRFRKLDRLKKHTKRPLLRVREEHGLVTVYSFPTNKLHVKEFEFRKGDILEQEVADKSWKTLTVLDVLADRVTLQADGREHDVFYDEDWSTIRKPGMSPRSARGASIRLKSTPLQVNDEVECDGNVKGTVYEITDTLNGKLIRVRLPNKIEFLNPTNCKKIVAPTPTPNKTPTPTPTKTPTPIPHKEVKFTEEDNEIMRELMGSYPLHNQEEIKKIYSLLRKYCDLKNVKGMNKNIGKNHCSREWIKTKMMKLFKLYIPHMPTTSPYPTVLPVNTETILEEILGEEEYNQMLNTFGSDDDDSDKGPIPKEGAPKGFRFDEVDGGGRRNRRTRRRRLHTSSLR